MLMKIKMEGGEKDFNKLTLEEIKEMMMSKNMGEVEKKKLLEKMLGGGAVDTKMDTSTSEVTVKGEKNSDKKKTKNEEKKVDTKDEWEECGEDALPECKAHVPQKCDVPSKDDFMKDTKRENWFHMVDACPMESSDLGTDLLQHYVALASTINCRHAISDGRVVWKMKFIFNNTEDAANCADDIRTIRDNLTVMCLSGEDASTVEGVLNVRNQSCLREFLKTHNEIHDSYWDNGWASFWDRLISLSGLPKDVTEEQIEELYPDNYYVQIYSDPNTGEPTGEGGVEFLLPNQANAHGAYHTVKIGDSTVRCAYFGLHEPWLNKYQKRNVEFKLKEPLTKEQRAGYVRAMRELKQKFDDYSKVTDTLQVRQKLEILSYNQLLCYIKDVFLQDNELRLQNGQLKKALPKDIHDYVYPGGKVPARESLDTEGRVKMIPMDVIFKRPHQPSSRGGGSGARGGSKGGKRGGTRGTRGSGRQQPAGRIYYEEINPQGRETYNGGGPIRSRGKSGTPLGRTPGGRAGQTLVRNRPVSSGYGEYPYQRKSVAGNAPVMRSREEYEATMRGLNSFQDQSFGHRSMNPVHRAGPPMDNRHQAHGPNQYMDEMSPPQVRNPAMKKMVAQAAIQIIQKLPSILNAFE